MASDLALAKIRGPLQLVDLMQRRERSNIIGVPSVLPHPCTDTCTARRYSSEPSTYALQFFRNTPEIHNDDVHVAFLAVGETDTGVLLQQRARSGSAHPEGRKYSATSKGIPRVAKPCMWLLFITLALLPVMLWATSNAQNARTSGSPLGRQCLELVVTRKGEIDGCATHSAADR